MNTQQTKIKGVLKGKSYLLDYVLDAPCNTNELMPSELLLMLDRTKLKRQRYIAGGLSYTPEIQLISSVNK